MLKFRVEGELFAQLKCSKQELMELKQLHDENPDAMRMLVGSMLEDSFGQSLAQGAFTVHLAVMASDDDEEGLDDPEAEREVQKLIQQSKRTIGFKPNDPNLN